MSHQQQVICYGSRVIEHAVGKSRQRQCPPLAFKLKENILSTHSNKNDMM